MGTEMGLPSNLSMTSYRLPINYRSISYRFRSAPDVPDGHVGFRLAIGGTICTKVHRRPKSHQCRSKFTSSNRYGVCS